MEHSTSEEADSQWSMSVWITVISIGVTQLSREQTYHIADTPKFR
jgi:hypothetical protein